MMDKRRQLWDFRHHTLVRYIVIGGTAYAIELLCIYTLRAILHDDVLAVGISFWIGLIVSFVLQKVIAFKNHNKTPRMLARQVATFSLLVLVNYVFTLAVVALTANIVSLFVARTVALIITTGWNFIIYKKIIFKH